MCDALLSLKTFNRMLTYVEKVRFWEVESGELHWHNPKTNKVEIFHQAHPDIGQGPHTKVKGVVRIPHKSDAGKLASSAARQLLGKIPKDKIRSIRELGKYGTFMDVLNTVGKYAHVIYDNAADGTRDPEFKDGKELPRDAAERSNRTKDSLRIRDANDYGWSFLSVTDNFKEFSEPIKDVKYAQDITDSVCSELGIATVKVKFTDEPEKGRAAEYSPAAITFYPGEKKVSTLIHEIGHHVEVKVLGKKLWEGTHRAVFNRCHRVSAEAFLRTRGRDVDLNAWVKERAKKLLSQRGKKFISRTIIADGKQLSSNSIPKEFKFTMPPWAKKEGDKFTTVWVDAKKFDDIWKKDKDMYVGDGGKGEMKGRRAGFFEFMQTGKPIEIPYVSGKRLKEGDPEFDQVHFGNGRHRFSVLRDIGFKKIPVVAERENAEELKRIAGFRD